MGPAISPCGRAVDSLRSCYKTTMDFGSDGLHEVPIRWYFVDEDTPWVGFPTPFCSRNWQATNKGEGGELGELLGAERVWVDGSPPPATPTTGKPCGSALQWDGSAPIEKVPLLGGLPLCCQPEISPPVVFTVNASLAISAVCVVGHVAYGTVAISGKVVVGTAIFVSRATLGISGAAAVGTIVSGGLAIAGSDFD